MSFSMHVKLGILVFLLVILLTIPLPTTPIEVRCYSNGVESYHGVTKTVNMVGTSIHFKDINTKQHVIITNQECLSASVVDP